ncbi:hypothetical protein AAHC03_020756 [Spirometra sp. Aus1]
MVPISFCMTFSIKFLLILQFEAQKILNASNPDVVDFELSDWASELLERLGICTSSRGDWRNFIKKALVDRFQKSHGKTLTQIYLNIGLEPPACLPALDGDDTTGISDSPTFPKETLKSPISSKDKNTRKKSPSPGSFLSPRSTRSAARKSLPRALFTDSIVLSSSDSTHSTRRLSYSTASAFSSVASTGSGRLVTPRSPPRCDSKRATPAPQLVLIPAGPSANGGRSSTKARRKARTPVKRLLSSNSPADAGPFGPKGPSSGRRSSRGAKLGSTPSPAPRATPRRSVRQSSRPSPSASLAEASPGTAVTTPSTVNHRRSTPGRRGSHQTEGRRRTGTSGRRSSHRRPHQHHRSVQETPNPKMSYPRWERARMAAAEKTKDKLVIVAESPVKPDSVLGSPLRRLRRASSLLEALRPSPFLSGGPLGADSSLSGGGEASTCTSIGMTRAERWRRRQYEEELSLSQFTQPLPASSSSPCCPLSPCEGSTQTLDGAGCSGRGLRRQSSNLFANLLLSPPDKRRRQSKPALTSTVSSPPVLALAARNLRVAGPSENDEPLAASNCPSTTVASFYLNTPPKNVFASLLDVGTPTQQKSLATSPFVAAFNSPAPAPSTPLMASTLSNSGLLTFGRPSTRPVSSRISSSKSEVPISPQVFDEAAMFLGEAEFLRKTTPARATVAEIVASPTAKIMSGSAARERPQLSPIAPSDDRCLASQKLLKQAQSVPADLVQRGVEDTPPSCPSPGGRLNTRSAQAPYSPTTALRSPLSPLQLSSNSSFRKYRSDFMPPTPGNDSTSNRSAGILLSPRKGLNGPIKTPKKVLFGTPLASAPILNLNKAHSPYSKPVLECSQAELQIAAGFEPEASDFQTLSSPPFPSQKRSGRQSLRSQPVLQRQRRSRRSLFH